MSVYIGTKKDVSVYFGTKRDVSVI